MQLAGPDDSHILELPETAVAKETRNVVYDLVQENAKRGVTRQSS